jgi:anion-transporting  ArsA/GET3 family ATPase
MRRRNAKTQHFVTGKRGVPKTTTFSNLGTELAAQSKKEFCGLRPASRPKVGHKKE